ncbi:DUF2239 family protein [Sphingopyxis granuli]|uniref:DUF2239 family protein n=1 Tax=Sphingopyxis granuli TaxID=267128 RepID=UPI001F534ABE|nr:DUF2239 family protein [Sphingopyxis granuli]UNK81028.1 DUF2239 family protein [Sphingopyxis granuli]
MQQDIQTVTAFLGDTLLVSGSHMTVRQRLEERYPGDLGVILVFDDATGKPVDLDYWDVATNAPPPSVGRPRLGVKAREVTLLPRHWNWLAEQPGGASAALRRLVEAASRAPGDGRKRKDAAYHFMSHMCGNLPGYEEALRALYRDDSAAFDSLIAEWPDDVRDHIRRLIAG